MEPSMKAAFSNWGWLASIGVAIVALAIVAYAQWNPVEEAADVVADVATGSQCPSGWENTSSESVDAPVKSCSRGNWVVVLTNEGKFSHGVELNRPGAVIIYDEALVPDWK